MNKIHLLAARALRTLDDLAKAIEATFGVKVEVYKNRDLESDCNLYCKGRKVLFGGIRHLEINGELCSFDFYNWSDTAYKATMGYHGPELRECDDFVAKIINLIKTRVKNAIAQREIIQKQQAILATNVETLASYQYLIDSPKARTHGCINVRPSNNVEDVFHLTLSTDVTKMAKILRILNED